MTRPAGAPSPASPSHGTPGGNDARGSGGTSPDANPAPTPGAEDAVRQGTAYGFLAYLLWGLLPLYFAQLVPATPWEVLGHRVLWSLLICIGLLALARQLSWLPGMFRNGRALLTMTAAGALIAVNWTTYTVAVMTGHVTEAALGYFLNPLVTVAMGVLLLRERLRPAQWVAVAIGLAAGVYLTIDYGALPWISLTLAFSFATYGLIKKRIGTSLTAVQSLTGETVVMAPVAAGVLIWLGVTGQQTFVGEGGVHTVLLVSTGVVTAVPLLLFAASAKRVPLVTIGLLQFIAPVLQLLAGVLVLGEVMPLSRWIGFGLVWIALIILTVDSVLSAGRSRRLARAAEGAAV